MYAKVLFVSFLVILIGCGKPPILNRVSTANNMGQMTQMNFEKFPQTNHTFFLKWQILPSLENLSAVDIYFTKNLTEEFVLDAEIVMKDHGHGSSPIIIEFNQARNIVSLTELSFFMTGKWTLILTLKEHNQIVDQWEKDIYL